MRIVSISDTHMRHGFAVPGGDVLVHAGDATLGGSKVELREFAEWFLGLPHPRKVFVPGNHDECFEDWRKPMALAMLPGVDYLEDSGVDIGGLKFWGSPWQPYFMDWAFNLQRGEELKRHWDLVPAGIDVLVTHSPPFGIRDLVPRDEHVGCADMLEMVHRVRPRLHVFGHIHEGYGEVRVGETLFVNASICDGNYRPVNAPIVVDL